VLEKLSVWDEHWKDCGAVSWYWWDWEVQGSCWRDHGTWRQGAHGLSDVASPNLQDMGSLTSQLATPGMDCT